MQRMTRQRTAIMEALREDQSFVSAQDLHERLTKNGTRIGLATVYRNLQALAASDDVDVVRVEDSDIQLFRYCSSEQHHHHLICRSCGTTQDIEAESVETWAQSIASMYGFTDVRHSLELYGLCSACSAPNNPAPSNRSI